MLPLGLLIYTACNSIPTFISTQLLFGNQRPVRTYAFQRIRILDPLNRQFVPLAGFSPYTTHYIIFDSLYLYRHFHSYNCLGRIFALQPSYPTFSHDDATHAVGSLRVPLCGVSHSFEQHSISCINK